MLWCLLLRFFLSVLLFFSDHLLNSWRHDFVFLLITNPKKLKTKQEHQRKKQKVVASRKAHPPNLKYPEQQGTNEGRDEEGVAEFHESEF